MVNILTSLSTGNGIPDMEEFSNFLVLFFFLQKSKSMELKVFKSGVTVDMRIIPKKDNTQ